MQPISVITPTWQRHEELLTRCIPSVQTQGYSNLEHIVVSDGPDPELEQKLASTPAIYTHLDYHHGKGYGSNAARRQAAKDIAPGSLVAYLDDDDIFLPDHIAVLKDALDRNPDAGFAYSKVRLLRFAKEQVIGNPHIFKCGHITTTAIMHRSELIDIANWPIGSLLYGDWALVNRWVGQGVKYVMVDRVTAEAY